MEIERKYLIPKLPADLDSYVSHHIVQAYISTDPVIRIRQKDDSFILTVKGPGLIAREEWELPLTEESFRHLQTKTEGRTIEKTRYDIPWKGYTIELDVFAGELDGLIIAEIEYPDMEAAASAVVPGWFGREVTSDPGYHNSTLSRKSSA